jgi:hypothetical protein
MNDQSYQHEMINILAELKDTPARDPVAIEQGRAAFLEEADRLSYQTVSISPLQRIISGFSMPQPRLRFSTLTVAIILSVFLLTFSSSVYAARRSQPDHFLYPFKLWLENSRLSLTQKPESQINLRLDYAEERLAELEGFSNKLADPALAAAIDNYDRQITAIEELIQLHDLDSSQRERLEKVVEEYHFLYGQDEEESEPPEGFEEESGDKGQTETEESEPAEDSEAQEDDHSGGGSDESESETPEDEEAPEETEEPELGDESDDEKEDETPEPTSDETDDGSGSDNDEKEEEETEEP